MTTDLLRSSPTPSTPSGVALQRRWWTLATLCSGLLIISIDNTIVNVALPTLARELGATNSELPVDNAGVGSAVNDTTRELGGGPRRRGTRQPARVIVQRAAPQCHRHATAG